MKVMLLSNMDFSGAGNAAVKIYKMLKKNNLDCTLYVNEKRTPYSSKFELTNSQRISERLRKFLYSGSNRLINLDKRNYYKSSGLFDSIYSTKINQS